MSLYDGNIALLGSIAFMAAGALILGVAACIAVASRRCAGCRAKEQCRQWLASGRREGYETFCANAGFIERMKAFAVR